MTLTNQNYFAKSDAELRFIIRDAGEAAHNMRGLDERAEGKYLDQVNDASTVLASRRKVPQKRGRWCGSPKGKF